MCQYNELPIIIPAVTCYAHHTYPLIAIYSQNKYDSWLFSNYIQLFWEMPRSALNFAVSYPAPCLIQTECIANDFDKLFSKGISELIVDAINVGYYVQLQVDQYYIPYRSAYQKYHISHEELFSGYDLKNKKFKILGYDSYSIFRESEVDFDNVRLLRCPAEHAKNNYDVILMKYKGSCDKEIDIQQIITGIKDYLGCNYFYKNISKFNHDAYKNDCYFGVNIYDRLIMHCEESEIPDIRFFHVLYEHKKIMRMRCEFIEQKLGLSMNSVKWRDFEKRALGLRNRIMKNELKREKKENYLDYLKGELRNYLLLDKELMTKMLNELECANR